MGKWLNDDRFGDLNIPILRPASFDISELYDRDPPLIAYRTNKFGFRGGEYEASDIDILALGGSTTKEGMIADGETWTDRLAKMLSDDLDRKIVIANAGQDAQSTFGHIVTVDVWLKKIRDLRPKFILALVGVNDQSLGRPLKGFDDFNPRNRYHRIRTYIWNHSALYDLYRRARGVYRAYVTRVIHMSRSPVDFGETYPDADLIRVDSPVPEMPPQIRDDLAEHLAAYESRLTVLTERIRSLGAKPVLINQIRGDLVDYGDYFTYKKLSGWELPKILKVFHTSRLYARETMRICKKLRAVCIDLAGGVTIPADERYDLVHTTPQGAKRIAEFVMKELAPHVRAAER